MARTSELQRWTEQVIDQVSLRIRTLRKERGLTVRELAERCGMKRANVSRIETQGQNLQYETLCRISAALDVPLSALFEGIDTLDAQKTKDDDRSF